MGTRRSGRELALQVLYGVDLSGDAPEAALERWSGSFDAPAEVAAFARALALGVTSNRAEIDAIIAGASENWRLERMSVVDRNILRIAVFEMIHTENVPVTVAIDEAIEIAKSYGTEASPAFINGILDRVAAGLAARERKGEER
jgi:N utilization substance protein B